METTPKLKKDAKPEGNNYFNENISKNKKDAIMNTREPFIKETPSNYNDNKKNLPQQEQSTSPKTKVKKEPKSLKEPAFVHTSHSNSVVQNSAANVSTGVE